MICFTVWGELSWCKFLLGRVVFGQVVFGPSCPDSMKSKVNLSINIQLIEAMLKGNNGQTDRLQRCKHSTCLYFKAG